MKRLPFLLLAAVLAICSCKNSQELINEKAEQYKKEGKIILNKSDYPTGKEHYIVFADVNEQTIGIHWGECTDNQTCRCKRAAAWST